MILQNLLEIRKTHWLHQMGDKARLPAARDVLLHSIGTQSDASQLVSVPQLFHHFCAGAVGKTTIRDHGIKISRFRRAKRFGHAADRDHRVPRPCQQGAAQSLLAGHMVLH